LYPASFRERFASDMERDFAELFDRRGAAAAWAAVLRDLPRSIWISHAVARAERRHVQTITLGQPGGPSMGSLVFDLRHAVRALARAPIFTAIVVVTLALGIGANSAIFSLVNAALIRPLGYLAPERLMAIYEGTPRTANSAECANGRQRARLGTAEGVIVAMVVDVLSFGATRQVDVLHEHVARVDALPVAWI
jgi:hypothetical protein